MAEQDLDRNEEATPYKLQKAREKGQVSKSAEVVSALVFTVAIVYLNWKGWDGLVAQFGYDHALLTQAGRIEPSAANLWHLVGGMIRDAGFMLAPFLGALMLAAIVGNMMQTGPILSMEPVQPDFDRLNPVNGLKKVFSMRTLFDGARAIVKLLLLTLVVYYSLKSLVPQFFHLAALPPAGLARTIIDDAASTGLKIALMLCLIALVDYGYTRREFNKKMRMSRRDLKDEGKNREGDPRIRARLRELRREALKRSMAAAYTKNADVLLTNPTHFAVALRYVHGEMQSPQMIAKGTGTLAAKMREIAARHSIPVVQNPPLARELYHSLEVDQHVPPSLYAQVARIMVWVFAMKQARTGAAPGAAT
ncbi:flagellar biosynthesis protein FlhB [Ramlibacter sp. WS9]|uniref:EscU/YscU/HrcU family type III secretion system export apparatus switch protein n=1 Tax=Ramlibacter sp. WS9 TaxID=1882741 RepID=UPI001144ED48|nr:EscU/YscU/HrcU family type III secretion system export apparatus switch protein [Ramlibacter sp. WS9]ROZ63181.1 EscU/YscU/HrcU family type III secretion system export apparatus switch protein [Ramlibacter sp. WS9]